MTIIIILIIITGIAFIFPLYMSHLHNKMVPGEISKFHIYLTKNSRIVFIFKSINPDEYQIEVGFEKSIKK